MTGSMHQGGLNGDADRVRRVVRAELVEHVRPVNFHRARAYRQALADKTVGQSAGDAAENLSLAARQRALPTRSVRSMAWARVALSSSAAMGQAM